MFFLDVGLNDVFINFGNFLGTFFWSINQFLKLFFNDIVIFGIAIGWWFLMFATISLIIYRIGGE